MLTVGDKVMMNGNYRVSEKYKGKEFLVTAGPQEVGGTMYDTHFGRSGAER